MTEELTACGEGSSPPPSPLSQSQSHYGDNFAPTLRATATPTSDGTECRESERDLRGGVSAGAPAFRRCSSPRLPGSAASCSRQPREKQQGPQSCEPPLAPGFCSHPSLGQSQDWAELLSGSADIRQPLTFPPPQTWSVLNGTG